MNTNFVNYTRSATFSMTLTEHAIQELLFMLHGNEDCERNRQNPREYPMRFLDCRHMIGYLMRRGLIEVCGHGYTLTTAGILTAKLLKEAGFETNRRYGTMFPQTIEN